MIINSIIVYHFVDPDLRFQIFFEEEGRTKNGSFDSEIENMGTSSNLYWELKKFHAEPVYFFIEKVFSLVTKCSSWKLSWPILSSLNYWIILICLATVQLEEKIHTKAVADVSRRAGRRVFLNETERRLVGHYSLLKGCIRGSESEI